MKYVQPIGKAAGASYVDGDPDNAIEGDAVSGRAWEHPMREIENVIEESGLDPSEDDLTQLDQAIDAKIAAASGLSPYDIPFNAGLDGDLAAEDLEIKHYGTMTLAREITPVSVVAKLETAPRGSSIVFDVTSNGASIYRALPSFAADTGNYAAGRLKPDIKIAQGAILRFSVSAVGTRKPGKGLRISIKGKV